MADTIKRLEFMGIMGAGLTAMMLPRCISLKIAKEAKQDKLITLIISSTSGGEIEEKFNINMKIRAVKVKAMAHLKLNPSLVDNYCLIFEGNPLLEDKTLEELNIPDGAELLMEKLLRGTKEHEKYFDIKKKK